MANRPIHETRLGKVKAAIWPNKKSRRDSRETLRLLNVPGGIRTCDLRFRKPTLYPAELRGLDGGRIAGNRKVSTFWGRERFGIVGNQGDE